MKDVVIIGAGIAGLTAGFELEKENIDFHILEISNRTGGNIETKKIGNTLIERGPYTLTSSGKEVFELINDLALTNQVIEANSESKKRFIYFNKNLVQVPMTIKELYKTELLSKEGKKTLLEEFFINKVDEEETVEAFISRRFGREALKNIVQPFLCGIFAGDVKKLSANSVFPKLKELENKYKSILLGFGFTKGLQLGGEKHTLFSFKDGMGTLINELTKKLNNKITLNVNNIEIARAKDCFIVTFKSNNKTIKYTTHSVLFAMPAYEVLNYPHLFPNKHSMEIFHTEYMPIAVVSHLIDKNSIKTPLDGFGFLCTKEPHRKLLGTIWSSSIFQGRTLPDKALFTSFIGGAYHPKIINQPEEEISNQVMKELSEIMEITKQESIETLDVKLYEKAIPQYYIGHELKVKHLEEVMEKNFGLFFTGNYLYGISVNDTTKTSKQMVKRILNFLNTVKKDLVTN